MDYFSSQLPDDAARENWLRRTLRRQFEIVRHLSSLYRRPYVVSLYPPPFAELFEELLHEACSTRSTNYVDTMISGVAQHGREVAVVRSASRLVRT